MSKLINISDVKLKSLSVEIKALTVNGKQMTLAVFRQLPARELWDKQFKLLGIPWGRVRYFWGEDKDCTGFQVVWQDADILYRSMHYQPRPVVEYTRKRDLENRLRDLSLAWPRSEPELVVEDFTPPMEVPDFTKRYHPDMTLERYRLECRQKNIDANARHRQQYENDLKQYREKEQARAELAAQIKAIDDRSAAAFAAWTRAHQALEALPQLFIAL